MPHPWLTVLPSLHSLGGFILLHCSNWHLNFGNSEYACPNQNSSPASHANTWPQLDTSPIMFHWLPWTHPKQSIINPLKSILPCDLPLPSHPTQWPKVILDSSLCLHISSKTNQLLISPHHVSLMFYTSLQSDLDKRAWGYFILLSKIFQVSSILCKRWPKLLSRIWSFLNSLTSSSALPCLGFCACDSKLLNFTEMYDAIVWFFTVANSFNSAWNCSSTSSHDLYLQAQVLSLSRWVYLVNKCLLSTYYVPGTEIRAK